jgi:hypothetical protein
MQRLREELAELPPGSTVWLTDVTFRDGTTAKRMCVTSAGAPPAKVPRTDAAPVVVEKEKTPNPTNALRLTHIAFVRKFPLGTRISASINGRVLHAVLIDTDFSGSPFRDIETKRAFRSMAAWAGIHGVTHGRVIAHCIFVNNDCTATLDVLFEHRDRPLPLPLADPWNIDDLLPTPPWPATEALGSAYGMSTYDMPD